MTNMTKPIDREKLLKWIYQNKTWQAWDDFSRLEIAIRSGELDADNGEVERLRAALEKIIDIAREALSKSPPEPSGVEHVDINEWAKDIIEGPGGMNDYEQIEHVVWNESDRVAAAKWTIRCLANQNCEGSEHVLQAILERRKRESINAPEKEEKSNP